MNITIRYNVLDLEIFQLWSRLAFSWWLDFHHSFVVDPCGLKRRVFTPRTCDDHLARSEDQRSGPRLANAHDYSVEPLRVVLCVATPVCQSLEVYFSAVKVACRDYVLKRRRLRLALG